MISGFADVGKVYDPDLLRRELQGVDLSWAKGVTMHHTFFPDLKMRPRGLTVQHIRNIEHGYRTNPKKRWSAGPHLFVDEDQGFGMCPFSRRGVHAVSFNRDHIGVECLGNWDDWDEAETTRAKHVFENASRLVAVICEAAGWDERVVNGHRDDPKTKKTCPGKHFDLDVFRSRVAAHLEDRGLESTPDGEPAPFNRAELEERVKAIEWQLAQMKKLLRS